MPDSRPSSSHRCAAIHAVSHMSIINKPDRVRTCGTMPKRSRISFLASSGRCVTPNSGRIRLTADTQPPRTDGLLLCSWPKGGEPTLPFVYSNEVWTGIEYQVASHLIIYGVVEAGLDIVRTLRRRCDGRIRNPYNEYECGHWYARAMASYGLLQALSGIRYDAVDKTLYVKPVISGDQRWRSFPRGYFWHN